MGISYWKYSELVKVDILRLRHPGILTTSLSFRKEMKRAFSGNMTNQEKWSEDTDIIRASTGSLVRYQQWSLYIGRFFKEVKLIRGLKHQGCLHNWTRVWSWISDDYIKKLRLCLHKSKWINKQKTTIISRENRKLFRKGKVIRVYYMVQLLNVFT